MKRLLNKVKIYIVNYFVARGKECIEKLSEKIEIVEDISDNEDDF